MLQVIISPAKQMRVCASAFAAQGIPPYPQRTATLHQRLLQIERQDGKDALRTLWSVSDRLLQQNLDRLHAFEPLMDASDLNNPELARLVSPAAFSYVGIQYQSMAPEVLDQESLAWLQSHLWILSGLYGCARPFDAVQPYRLEMGAKLAADGAKNLYAFWGDALARAVCGYMDDETPPKTGAAAHAGTCVVNLASVEYLQRRCFPIWTRTRAASPASLARTCGRASPCSAPPQARPPAVPWFAGWRRTA